MHCQRWYTGSLLGKKGSHSPGGSAMLTQAFVPMARECVCFLHTCGNRRRPMHSVDGRWSISIRSASWTLMVAPFLRVGRWLQSVAA